MQRIPKKIEQKLNARRSDNALRELGKPISGIDFYSNDYLGLSQNKSIQKRAHEILEETKLSHNGATGSRLLSGNHALYEHTETLIASYHRAEKALIFTSGYTANLGFFSSVPQRGDVIFYDEWCHASIRDGIAMSNAKSFKFKHNDLDDLSLLVARERDRSSNQDSAIYVITESLFSMDGDSPNLLDLTQFCDEQECFLIVDEAHAIGVLGEDGEGLVAHLGLEDKVYARLMTFGKAMGSHGAAILGDALLIEYLINFARSFIYTTAMPPHTVATIYASYEFLSENDGLLQDLAQTVVIFRQYVDRFSLTAYFLPSESVIQALMIPENLAAKQLAAAIHKAGFEVKAILAPTVPKGKERLRMCLHVFNNETQIQNLLTILQRYLHP